MQYKRMAYSGTTAQQAMMALARAHPSDNLHTVDLPYRLSSWALDVPENTGLWFDERRQLVGWAVLQSPFWTIDCACDPAVEADLYPEILAWADQRARESAGGQAGRPAWFVMAFSGQEQRRRDLEAAGFRCQSDVGEDSWSKVLMRLATAAAPAKIYKPPQGFTARPLAGAAEAQGYVDLHQSVFESKNMTLEWRQRTLEQPAYRPELDIVIEAPDGRLGAFCIGWLDPESGDGHVEPLGCHKDFRKNALGRVALSEGLQRLQALGAKDIFVETDNYRDTAFRLYRSFGFEVVQEVLVYRKDYGGA